MRHFYSQWGTVDKWDTSIVTEELLTKYCWKGYRLSLQLTVRWATPLHSHSYLVISRIQQVCRKMRMIYMNEGFVQREREKKSIPKNYKVTDFISYHIIGKNSLFFYYYYFTSPGIVNILWCLIIPTFSSIKQRTTINNAKSTTAFIFFLINHTFGDAVAEALWHTTTWEATPHTLLCPGVCCVVGTVIKHHFKRYWHELK